MFDPFPSSEQIFSLNSQQTVPSEGLPIRSSRLLSHRLVLFSTVALLAHRNREHLQLSIRDMVMQICSSPWWLH